MSDLITRLRALADEHKHTLVGWEQRLVATLGEAADALDRLHHSRVPTGSLMAEVRELEQELDALKAKLAVEARYVAEYREAYCKEVARAEKAEAEVARLAVLWKDSERYLVGPEHVAAAERADNAQKALEEMNGAWLEARAEAAAMREVATNLLKYIKGVQGGDWSDSEKALSQPGPGAALLERVKRYEEALEWVAGVTGPSFLNDIRQCARAALEEKP